MLAHAAGCAVILSRGKALRIMAEVARLEEAHNDGHPVVAPESETTPTSPDQTLTESGPVDRGSIVGDVTTILESLRRRRRTAGVTDLTCLLWCRRKG